MTTTVPTDTADSGFDLALGPEQELVQRTARDFATEKLLPIAADIDREAAVPKAILSELAALGFMGVCVPTEQGGAGLDAVSYVLALEEINRACASTGVIMSVNNSLVCDPLLRFGTAAQHERWLRPLATGAALGCFALSEPASGSDAKSMRTSARQDGDGWVLTGTKNFITNGASADTVLVFAQTDPDLGHKGIAAFIVDKATAGLTVGKIEHKLGIRGSDTAQLVFRGLPRRRRPAPRHGGRGLQDRALRAGRWPDLDRGAGRWHRPGLSRGRPRVREGENGVRQADRGTSGDPVDARGHGDRDRRRAAPHLACGGAQGARRAVHRRSSNGQALRLGRRDEGEP